MKRFFPRANLLVVFTLLLLFMALPVWAINPGVIMEKSHLASYYQGDDGKAFVRMKIVNKKGKVRKREFTILKKDLEDGGEQLYFVHFKKPGDVRNTTFLVKKHPGSNDDRWLFIPAIRMVKRVAASDKRGSFAGSDFTYEDISGRSPGLDSSKLLKEVNLEGAPVYVIENIPINPKGVEYSYRHTYVSKDNFLTLKDIYFNSKGNPIKEYEVLDWKVVQGFPTVVKSQMRDLKRKVKTEMEFFKLKYNIGLSQKIFSERSLKMPPKKWIN